MSNDDEWKLLAGNSPSLGACRYATRIGNLPFTKLVPNYDKETEESLSCTSFVAIQASSYVSEGVLYVHVTARALRALDRYEKDVYGLSLMKEYPKI
jgi:hypothetical protein